MNTPVITFFNNKGAWVKLRSYTTSRGCWPASDTGCWRPLNTHVNDQRVRRSYPAGIRTCASRLGPTPPTALWRRGGSANAFVAKLPQYRTLVQSRRLRGLTNGLPLLTVGEAVLQCMLGAKTFENIAGAAWALQAQHRLGLAPVVGRVEDVDDVAFEDVAERREDVAAGP